MINIVYNYFKNVPKYILILKTVAWPPFWPEIKLFYLHEPKQSLMKWKNIGTITNVLKFVFKRKKIFKHMELSKRSLSNYVGSSIQK